MSGFLLSGGEKIQGIFPKMTPSHLPRRGSQSCDLTTVGVSARLPPHAGRGSGGAGWRFGGCGEGEGGGG